MNNRISNTKDYNNMFDPPHYRSRPIIRRPLISTYMYYTSYLCELKCI